MPVRRSVQHIYQGRRQHRTLVGSLPLRGHLLATTRYNGKAPGIMPTRPTYHHLRPNKRPVRTTHSRTRPSMARPSRYLHPRHPPKVCKCRLHTYRMVTHTEKGLAYLAWAWMTWRPGLQARRPRGWPGTTLLAAWEPQMRAILQLRRRLMPMGITTGGTRQTRMRHQVVHPESRPNLPHNGRWTACWTGSKRTTSATTGARRFVRWTCTGIGSSRWEARTAGGGTLA